MEKCHNLHKNEKLRIILCLNVIIKMEIHCLEVVLLRLGVMQKIKGKKACWRMCILFSFL